MRALVGMDARENLGWKVVALSGGRGKCGARV